MDDKVYTCFYCHSILPYDVCISGTHFCLQSSTAIEFWGNVVKIASTNSVDEQETDGTTERTFKVEEEEAQIEAEIEEETGETEMVMFSEMESDETLSHNTSNSKSVDDSEMEDKSDVKSMNWRLKMIALVKQRPPLYDKRLPLSERTFPIRAKLWKEVYEGLNGLVPIELLPKRFKVLRDRYNKEVKRLKTGHLSRKPWSLFKYLTFLSITKKKICVKKLSLVNGDCKVDDVLEKTPLDAANDKIIMNLPDRNIDDESFKENLDVKKKFVQLVGERPPLYDCRLPRPIRVAENKVRLWREVYDSLSGAIPLVDLPRKFKSLRDRYMKEKKKQLSDEPLTQSWPLMEYMTYLDDVAYIRSHDSNSTQDSSTLSQEKRRKMDDKKSTGDSVSVGGESGSVQAAMSPLDNLSDKGLSPSNEAVSPDHTQSDRVDIDQLMDNYCENMDQSKPTSRLAPLPSSNRPKKLDPAEAFDTWTEDDFFGAYLVRLMRKIPIEEKLRLHTDIINMIKKFLTNRQD